MMVKSAKLMRLWLVLLLVLGPGVAGLAAVQAATHDQHHAGAVHADRLQAEDGQGNSDHHGAGHNHSGCGVQCLAGLPSMLLPVNSIYPAAEYFTLFVPVTGTVVAPASRPPQFILADRKTQA